MSKAKGVTLHFASPSLTGCAAPCRTNPLLALTGVRLRHDISSFPTIISLTYLPIQSNSIVWSTEAIMLVLLRDPK